MKKNICIVSFLFLFGGAGYCLIEIAARGFTHWSMGVVGGVCFLILTGISKYAPWKGVIRKSLAGCACITFVEFGSGLIVNIWLNLDVWSYASLPLNLMGQICAEYSFYWFLLCLPVISALELPRFIRYLRIKKGV